MICMDNNPSILFNTCLHHIVCFECFKKILPKECIICKQKIDYILLY